MKILYVITCGDRGGAQVAVMDLVRNLPDGFEPVVVSGQDGYVKDSCARAGIPFRRVRSLIRQIQPLSDVQAFFQLMSLIRTERPDLVHAHTTKAGILARVAAWFMRTPSVFTAHTWSFDGDVPPIAGWLAVPLERLAALVSGPIIVVSSANAAKALARSIAAPNRIVTIWLGIPDTLLLAQPGPRSQVTIIMVARFVEQKAHKLTLRALAELRGDWVFQFVGHGPLLAENEALARQLGLQDKVRFLGERNDIPELLARADIFVLASHWEGLPLVILESMRAGLPVVATNVGGVSEMVTDGVTGFLTAPGDSARLRERMQTLVNSAELRASMGQAARRRFEQDFRIEASVRKTVAVYDALHTCEGKRSELAGEECAS